MKNIINQKYENSYILQVDIFCTVFDLYLNVLIRLSHYAITLRLYTLLNVTFTLDQTFVFCFVHLIKGLDQWLPTGKEGEKFRYFMVEIY